MHSSLLCGIYALILLPTSLTLNSNPEMARGIVFEDTNANGVYDVEERGITGISVSNQLDVVQTDTQGRFELPVSERTIIFVSKPASHQFPLDINKLPLFYYLHFPKGSPESFHFKYAGIQPTGELPEILYFPLLPNNTSSNQKQFSAVITGDPQPVNDTEIDYFRDDIITDMLKHDASFYMALGDIVFDTMSLYPRYMDAVSQLGLPAYNVAGNHDMNYRSPNDTYANETFRSRFGPEYYSFDYGDVHFIILDDVEYLGWNIEKDSYGKYIGKLSKQQLVWLENDLEFVPENKLIVISKHIPIKTVSSDAASNNLTNSDKLFQILQNRKKILALSGHTHMTEFIQLTEKDGWLGSGELWSMNLGAACGAWWSGPKDTRGIPAAFGLDGSPNGYFIFSFDGMDYDYSFQSANQPSSHQIRVISPLGTLTPSVIQKTGIAVNFFIGGDGSEVVCRIDDGVELSMQRTKIKDAFILNYFNVFKEFMPHWLNDIHESTHIWVAKNIPAIATTPGMHSLKITATNHLSNQYTEEVIYEVIEE